MTFLRKIRLKKQNAFHFFKDNEQEAMQSLKSQHDEQSSTLSSHDQIFYLFIIYIRL